MTRLRPPRSRRPRPQPAREASSLGDAVVELRISALTIDPATNLPVLLLEELEGAHALSLWIGVVEASAIALLLEGIVLERPMTHDLLHRLVEELGASVERACIDDLRRGTFHAKLWLRQKCGESLALDARPSDAIAVALRASAPIAISKRVLARARKTTFGGKPTGQVDARRAHPPPDLLETLPDEEFGKWKM